ncbi:MAG TPA: SDR family oxidoreductase [Acidimicrobiales bacterium]|nr:SDR family oxidoreductase [Acidimicrobiales bacterium]
MSSLSGRTAVVTGGASGIGFATARRFAAEGADVVIADIADEAGEKAAADVGGRFHHLDVSDLASWDAFLADEPMIDVAHLNAGVVTGSFDGFESLTDEQYRRIMSVNVDGVVNGFRVLPRVMSERGGSVVVTASVAGIIPFPQDPIYTMTKHAVLGLARSLAPLFGPKGIRINAVCPGITETPLLGKAIELLRSVGFPVVDPNDVAAAVLEAATSPGYGEAWIIQPGLCERYRFHSIPGPKLPGTEGTKPPLDVV